VKRVKIVQATPSTETMNRRRMYVGVRAFAEA
jgi:hypothetical protein